MEQQLKHIEQHVNLLFIKMEDGQKLVRNHDHHNIILNQLIFPK
jgi:hypothetical protein